MDNNKQRQPKIESRERILVAAVALFARQGYGNTGLRELAAAADVNLAMINYLFGSKKKLLKEILDIFFIGYLAIAEQEMEGREEFTVKLERFIHAAVDYFADNRDYLLVTIGELPHDDPEITGHKAGWGRRFAEIIGRELQTVGSTAIPAVTFCSMLTSIMASRFLFTPVMDQVAPNMLSSVSIREYAEIVAAVFITGAGSMIGPAPAEKPV